MQTTRRLVVRVCEVALLGLVWAVSSASAATIEVSESCSLVDAINSANEDASFGGCTAGSGADTIVLPGGVLEFSTAAQSTSTYGPSGTPIIVSPVTIEGNGTTLRRVGSSNLRLLTVLEPGSLILKDAILEDGRLGASVSIQNLGGCLFNYQGTLDIRRTTFSNCRSEDGFGVYSRGDLLISRSLFTGCSARNNTVGPVSGAVLFHYDSNPAGTKYATITNTTFTGGNRYGVRVASAASEAYADATLNNVTISGNAGGWAATGLNSTLRLRNTVSSGNTVDSYEGATILDLGHNMTGGDAMLGPLADNGGPTLTMMPQPGSPLRFGGDNASCASVDQRGVSRPYGAVCDIGAVEVDVPLDVELAVSLSVDKTEAIPGADDVEYTVIVTNSGVEDDPGATLEVSFPSGITKIIWSCSGDCPDNSGAAGDIWVTGLVPAGATHTYSIYAEVGQGATGTKTVTATLTPTTPDSQPGDDTASVSTTLTPEADLKTSVSAEVDPVSIGAPFELTLVTSNNGPSRATGTQATLTLPPEATFVSAQNGCSHAAGVVTCGLNGINAGGGKSRWISVEVGPGAGDSVTFSADATTNVEELKPGNTGSSLTLAVESPNQPPSFVSGGDLTVLEDAGPQSLAWATGIDPGGPDELGQAVSFIVTTEDEAAFAVPPSVDALGTLSFETGPDVAGDLVFAVSAVDDAGGASEAVTVTLSVSPVNDPPSFTPGADQLGEAGGGPVSVPWATEIDPGGGADEADQEVSFELEYDAAALFAQAPAIDSSGALSYALVGDCGGSATVWVVARDDGGTEDGGVDASEAVAFTISSDAPGGGLEVVPLALETAEDTPRAVDLLSVLAPCVSAEGLSFEITSDPALGTLEGVAPALTYVPTADVHGADTFGVAVSDGEATLDALVTITVTPVNDAPQFVAPTPFEVVQAVADELLVLTVAAADLDGDALTLSVVDLPEGASFDADSGEVSWRPAADQVGSHTLGARADDGTVVTALALTIEVEAGPAPPEPGPEPAAEPAPETSVEPAAEPAPETSAEPGPEPAPESGPEVGAQAGETRGESGCTGARGGLPGYAGLALAALLFFARRRRSPSPPRARPTSPG